MNAQDTKTHRWQRLLLVGSLALNLAVVGVVAGIAFGGGPKERLQRFDLTVGPLTRAMDQDRRDAVRDALRDSGAFRPADRSGMRRDMAALLDALRDDQFDVDAFRDVLMRQRERLQSGQAAVVDAVAVQVTDMSAQERAAFADRLEEQLRRGPSNRSDRNDRSGG
jgi:uncharacterized membrane protein